jgi:hypothetical protein
VFSGHVFEEMCSGIGPRQEFVDATIRMAEAAAADEWSDFSKGFVDH